MSSNKSFADKVKERFQRGWERGEQHNAERARAQRAQPTTTNVPTTARSEKEYLDNMSMADTYRAMGKALLRSVPGMTQGVIRAHGIDATGAPGPLYSDGGSTNNTDNTKPTDYSSSHGPRFGEEGYGGRYPQQVNTTDGQPTAQSSTGPPYEVNRPEIKVGPNDIKPAPPSFR